MKTTTTTMKTTMKTTTMKTMCNYEFIKVSNSFALLSVNSNIISKWEKLLLKFLHNSHIKIKINDVSQSTCDKKILYEILSTVEETDTVCLEFISTSTLYNQNVKFTGIISQSENCVILKGELKTECAIFTGTMAISETKLKTEQFFMDCIEMIDVNVSMNLKITVRRVFNQCHSSTGQYSIKNDIISLKSGDFLIKTQNNGLRIILPHTQITVFVYDLPYNILWGLMREKVITLLFLDNFERLFESPNFKNKMKSSIYFDIFFSNISNMFQEEFEYPVGFIRQEIRYAEIFLTKDENDDIVETTGYTKWTGAPGTNTVLSITGFNFVQSKSNQYCICSYSLDYDSSDSSYYSSDYDSYYYGGRDNYDYEFNWQLLYINDQIPSRVILITSKCYNHLELYVKNIRSRHDVSRKTVEQIVYDLHDPFTVFRDERYINDELHNVFDLILSWKIEKYSSPKTVLDYDVKPIEPSSWTDTSHKIRCPCKRTLEIIRSNVPLEYRYNSDLSILMSLQGMQHGFNMLLNSFGQMKTCMTFISMVSRKRETKSYSLITTLVKRMLNNPTIKYNVQLKELNKNACSLINNMMTKQMKSFLFLNCMKYNPQ